MLHFNANKDFYICYICEQFLNMHVDLGSNFVLCICLGLSLLFFCVSLDHFLSIWLAFVVLGLV